MKIMHERVIERRHFLGLTQEGLAMAANLGRSTIQQLEKADRETTLRLATKLSNALKCRLEYLTGEYSEMGGQEEKEQTCPQCYFSRIQEGVFIQCLRYPPRTALKTLEIYGKKYYETETLSFPRVNELMWCGEFKLKDS